MCKWREQLFWAEDYNENLMCASEFATDVSYRHTQPIVKGAAAYVSGTEDLIIHSFEDLAISLPRLVNLDFSLNIYFSSLNVA